MLAEVATTLTALDLPDEHAAAAALARIYAGQLDSAEATERQADRALTAALADGVDTDTAELLQTLRSKLAARTTVANIGPRLESLLGKLLATPKDAGATAAPAEAPRAATPGALSLLRGGKSG
jgi:hypothetical protein